MLDRLIRLQLAIFAIVTVLTVGAISAFYLHLPAAVGIGSYNVTANFVAGGGLYKNANVTYRGVTVGRVESVGLTNDGVVAHMRLNSNTPVPQNVTATVKSVSAVGEQYIDLVPPDEASGSMLRDGSNIDQQHTAIGQDIAGLLREADALVSSIGNSRLQDLLSETFKAFNGSGPELARLIQSSRLLVDEANANYGQVAQLIDQAGPFLEAQIRGGDDIRSLADGLARFTGEVANADPQVRSVLQVAPGAAAEANETFSGIRPTFPVLAANLANFGRIGVIYNKSLEQALVIFPALLAALITVAGGVPVDEGGKLDFKIHLQDPPGCSVGFIPPPLIRSPADTTLRELPPDLYCKVPHSDPSVVRGRAQLSVPGVPGQAGTHHPALPRPAGLRADRQQPVARSAHPGGYADGRTGRQSLRATRTEYPAAQQVPVHPSAGRSGPRTAGGAVATRGAAGSRAGAARTVPAAGAAERAWHPAAAVALLRTAGPGRAAVRQNAASRQGHYPCRSGGRARAAARANRHRHCPRRCRPHWQVVRPSRPTTRTGSSSTRPAGLASTRPVLTNWRPRRTG